jgi:DNA polymerase elongation subunit (family B)
MKKIRKRREVKRRFWKYGAFDIETYGLDARAFAFGVCSWWEKKGSEIVRKYEVFFDREKMAKFMISDKFRGYIWWGHNAGAYDLIGLFGNYLTNRDFKVVFNKSRFIKAIYKAKTGHTIKFYDSLNIFQSSLERIGQDILNEKLETPDKFKVSDDDIEIIKHMVEVGKWTEKDVMRIYGIGKETVEAILTGKFERTITLSDIHYCIRDTEIVLDAITKLSNWVYDHFRVNISPTIASLSLRIFFTHFIKNDIYVSGYDQFFRNSYYGGRVEVFRDRWEWRQIKYYDFNSLYPSVMFLEEYPDPSSLDYTPFPDKSYIYEFEGVSEVTVYVPEAMEIPPLPIRHSGKLIFPVGFLRGWWNHNELRMAEKYGAKILKVHKTIYAKRTMKPFRGFVQFFYSLRQNYKKEGNKTYDLFTKIIMNSLYGKFGQLNEKSEVGFIDEERGDDWVFEPYGDSDVGVWKKIDMDGKVVKEDAKHSILCWASYVTSWARIYLYEKMIEAVRKGGKVYYCDTDSIITDVELEDSKELGQVKKEYEGKIFIIAPKTYILETNDGKIMKFKGIRNPDPDEIREEYYERRVVKVKEALRRRKEPGEPEIKVKKPRFVDEKRNWLSNTESKPWVYHELLVDEKIKEMVKRDALEMWKEIKSMKVARNIKEVNGEYRRFSKAYPSWYLNLKNMLRRDPTRKDLTDYLADMYNQVRDQIKDEIISNLLGGDVNVDVRGT